MAMSDAPLHAKHRERLIKRYIKYGSDAFDTHQLLEMLLFFSMPRGDTNPPAHELMKTYRLSGGVLSVPYKDILKTFGIGEKSSLLLKLSADLYRRAQMEEIAREPLDSCFRQQAYVFNWFLGKGAGTVAAFFLDTKFRILDTVMLASGRTFRPETYRDKVVEEAERINAKKVVLAHNHKDGVRKPSIEDICLTSEINAALEAKKIKLLEHYIVTDTDCVPCSRIGLYENEKRI